MPILRRHLADSARSWCSREYRAVKADRPSGAVSYRPAKRFVDKAVSIVLLILLAPVFAVALVAIALDGLLARRDRGPWLHRVRRVSAGREFDLLKFRTLKCTVLEQAQDPREDARLLERHPGNLTWAGRRILKPWYLDELPQLVNVLRGDISLVGPRPWPPSMVRDQVAAGHEYRNHVIAGWTGPVQVQKGIVDPEDYATLDVAYLEASRTLSSAGLIRADLLILWRTIKAIARRDGLTY